MTFSLFLQPPSPPGMDVSRDYAGGFGTAAPSSRKDYGHWPWTVPHVNLMYSAGLLVERGYDIAYVDAQAERMNLRTTVEEVCGHKPRMIVSVVNLPSLKGDGNLLRELRSRCPDAKVVSIGTICRVLPEEVASMGFSDIVVIDEPEGVIPNLADSIQNEDELERVKGIGIVRGGQLVRTEPATEAIDLKSLPWPPYDLMPTKYYCDASFGANANCLPVWASRGCPMPCSFYCPHSLAVGKKIRLRPSEDFVNEIEYLNHKFGISSFILRDQLFSTHPKKVEEICDLIVSKKLRIQWLCEQRFDAVDEKLLRRMKKAGCKRLHLGLETGDPELLFRVGKPGTEVAKVKEAVKIIKRTGITPMTHLIVGLPGETNQTLQNTLNLIREVGITRLNVNIATPYPGTPLYEYARDNGLIEMADWSDLTSFRSVMRTEELSTADLEEWKKYISERFLGDTFPQRMMYLMRSRGIIDYLRHNLSFVFERPSLLLKLFESYLQTHDVEEARRMLVENTTQ